MTPAAAFAGYAVAACALGAQPGWAQSAPRSADVDTFVARVRQSTLRYQDQGEALKDGYRRIGPDFPSMGEHWVNRAIIMQGGVDPLRPPILEYITSGGRAVLAGVAYASLVYGPALPSAIPAPPGAWHYHAGSVDEESFIASHAAGGAVDTTPGPRIAVLHAWLWAENPAGLFATDNWALPWLRLGISPPAGGAGADSVTLMAALAAGGEHYFTTMLRLRGGLDAEATDRIAGIFSQYAERLRAGRLTPSELAIAWSGMDAELRRVCGACSLMTRGH